LVGGGTSDLCPGVGLESDLRDGVGLKSDL
jgi:hypothetical protein